MALSKIDADGVTGLQETLTATTTVPSEGGAVTTNLAQGLAKSWVNFNGTGTIAARDSLNHASLVDGGTGQYTDTYSNPMTDTNYVAINLTSDGPNNFGPCGETEAVTTSSVQFDARYQGNNTPYDQQFCLVVIFGDLA